MFKTILVGLKMNAAGRYALGKAAELARRHEARLIVFHALDYRLAEDADRAALECVRARDRFEAEMKPALGDFPDYKLLCSPAEPAMEVPRLARELPADLVVLGCHQREGRAYSRMDYTGMTVLDKASCPVLLVPFAD